ncbi:MAG: DUF371 domain-containing protein [Candidatus Lokiarchaeota archaeon]|nr:DUF371 domain-containing protein [Candidatus Lokiarchaeota archaeon]
MPIIEKIYAWGHENILCTHRSTIEITKETNLTMRGDCVLAVGASKACLDLTADFKHKIKNGKKFKVKLEVDDIQDFFYGFGNKDLKLLDKSDVVFRKSAFICDRTVLINCSKSSKELSRELISKLENPEKKISLTFEVDE